jgi:DNA adenine methylase
MPVGDIPPLVPFLKWAGGKRWLVRSAGGIFPSAIRGMYYEPFLGGASVFASLKPASAILSDKNGELINVYRQVRNHWKEISSGLEEMHAKHSREFYYEIRERTDLDPLRRALKFIYLNRTCYNGLYRVNLNGRFNVPIGTKSSVVLPGDDFKGWARALRSTKILESDFEEMIDAARKGDLIFADPPYTVLHNQNCFLKYNEVLFSWSDQVRLADALKRADRRGATVIATNANHESVRELYQDRFSIWTISRASTIAAEAGKRGSYEEIIIRSRGAPR